MRFSTQKRYFLLFWAPMVILLQSACIDIKLKGSDFGFLVLYSVIAGEELPARQFMAAGRSQRHVLTSDGLNWYTDTYISTFNAITHCNGLNVAVGENGRIAYSGDGTNWMEAGGVPEKDLMAIACESGVFVVVGEEGLILRSTDSVTWVDRSDPINAGATTLLGVATDGSGRFVAVGYNGRVTVSTDGGISWGNLQNEGSHDLHGIAYGAGGCGGYYVAVGSDGKRMRSTDGINWVDQIIAGDKLYNVSCGNGVFVAVGGSERRLRSVDAGMSWGSDVSDNWYSNYAVTYDTVDNQFVVVGTFGRHRKSADGTGWSTPNTVSSSDITLRGVTYDSTNDFVLAVGYNGRILKSDDGVTWYGEIRDGENFFGLAYGDPGYVVVGTSGIRCFSSDGIVWSSCSYGGDVLYGVTYGNGLYVAVGDSGRRVISEDGINWTNDVTLGNRLQGVTYGNGFFVAVGNSGRRIRSRDGIVWEDDLTGGDNLRCVTFGNGVFVAAGDSERRVRSQDGQTWTDDTSGTLGLLSAAYDVKNGQFVLVGESRRILTSPDGINWTTQVVGGGKDLYAIACYAGLCITAGEDGWRERSLDGGVSWNNETSGGALFYALTVRPGLEP